MKKLFALAFGVVALSGCASDDTLFPSLDQGAQNMGSSSMRMQSDLPALGVTNFQPINIASGSSTGTFVGQKVESFRNELVNLQEAVKKHNTDLQNIRKSVISGATSYNSSINAVENKLQAGTTPGNPYVVSALQTAQNNISGMTGNAILTNQLATRVNSDIVLSSYVLKSIRDAYSISGAVDEDHAQLRVLEREASQTQVNLNNMLNEVNNDYMRQQQYAANSNKTVMSLENPVRVGRFGSAPASSYAPAPVMNMAPTGAPMGMDYNQPASSYGMGYPAMPTMSEAYSNRPLFSVRFDRSDVNYKSALDSAVMGALRAKPTMMFDVVSITPAEASSSMKHTARTKAGEIFQNVIADGVSPERVNLSAKTSAEVSAPEVHVYVK